MLAHFQRVYREGTASWDADDAPAVSRVRALVDRAALPARARVLDIGCGTGRMAALLAARGLNVVALDYCAEAIELARARIQAAGVDVRLVQGDVMKLAECGVVGPFDVLLDAGCFHSLADHERPDYAASVTRVAAPDAAFYMYALGRSAATPGPIGAGPGDIEHHFDLDWEIVAAEDFVSHRGEGRRAGWYSMRRRASPAA